MKILTLFAAMALAAAGTYSFVALLIRVLLPGPACRPPCDRRGSPRSYASKLRESSPFILSMKQLVTRIATESSGDAQQTWATGCSKLSAHWITFESYSQHFSYDVYELRLILYLPSPRQITMIVKGLMQKPSFRQEIDLRRPLGDAEGATSIGTLTVELPKCGEA